MTDAQIRQRLANLAGRCSPPGSDAAVDAGCTCPVLDNARGAGLPGGLFWMNDGCPVHINKETDHE